MASKAASLPPATWSARRSSERSLKARGVMGRGGGATAFGRPARAASGLRDLLLGRRAVARAAALAARAVLVAGLAGRVVVGDGLRRAGRERLHDRLRGDELRPRRGQVGL